MNVSLEGKREGKGSEGDHENISLEGKEERVGKGRDIGRKGIEVEVKKKG